MVDIFCGCPHSVGEAELAKGIVIEFGDPQLFPPLRLVDLLSLPTGFGIAPIFTPARLCYPRHINPYLSKSNAPCVQFHRILAHNAESSTFASLR